MLAAPILCGQLDYVATLGGLLPEPLRRLLSA
jgi:hypothetical protein